MNVNPVPFSPVKKIAILRANALGDFIFCLPALEALRHAYPDAEICFVGKPWHRDFLEKRPGPIDRVIVLPFIENIYKSPGKEDEIALARFEAAMQREKFDLVFQMHGGGRQSNPLVNRWHARMTIGCRTPDAAALDRWLPYYRDQREVLRYLELAALGGAKPVTLEPRISPIPADVHEAYQYLPLLTHDYVFVMINPGASDPYRRWPTARFAKLGDMLASHGARVIINGSPDERNICEEVIDRMVYPAWNLAGVVSLNGLVGVLTRCRFLISNDTGPLHLAAALGVPTLGFYWCYNHVTSAPVTCAQHRTLISWQTRCSCCNVDFNQCRQGSTVVDSITLTEASSAVLEMMPALASPPALHSFRQTGFP